MLGNNNRENENVFFIVRNKNEKKNNGVGLPGFDGLLHYNLCLVS